MTDIGYIAIRSKMYRVWLNIEGPIDGSIYKGYICAMDELIYIDDEWVAELIEEARLYDDVYIDTSWYKGAGWYDYYLCKVSGEA